MPKKIKGCVHLKVENGRVANVFTHLEKLPKNGLVHLKGDKVYTFKEFKKSHPFDQNELKKRKKRIIVSGF